MNRAPYGRTGPSTTASAPTAVDDLNDNAFDEPACNWEE